MSFCLTLFEKCASTYMCVLETRSIGEKMRKLTAHTTIMTTMVDVRLNHRGNPMGCVIAKYRSIDMAVMVKTLAPTATPKSIRERD